MSDEASVLKIERVAASGMQHPAVAPVERAVAGVGVERREVEEWEAPPSLAVVGLSGAGVIDRWGEDAARFFERSGSQVLGGSISALGLGLAREGGRMARRMEDLVGGGVPVIFGEQGGRGRSALVDVWPDGERTLLIFREGGDRGGEIEGRWGAFFAEVREQSREGAIAGEDALNRLLQILATHFDAEHVWIWRLDREGRSIDRAPFAEVVVPSYPHRPFGCEEGDRFLVSQSIGQIVRGRFRAIVFEGAPANAAMVRRPSRFLAVRLQHLLPTGWALVLERSSERRAWGDVDVALLDRGADLLALVLEGRALRKQAGEQASYLRSVLGSSDLGVLLIDHRIGAGWVLLSNERCRQLLGEESEVELTGLPVARLLETVRYVSNDWNRDGAILRGLLADREGEGEGEIALGKSAVRVLRVRAAPARGESGEIFGRVLLFRDVSQDKEMEHQLLHSQKMKSIGTLAGGIAHDFNNLLTTMLGYAELLKRDLADDHPSYARVVHIERSARRAAELTTGLLAFSRRTVANMRVMDLSALVRETLGMIRFSLPGTVELALHAEPGLPLIEGDEAHLQQVLINVVLNARDAVGERGHITVIIRRGSDTQAQGEERPVEYVVLEVEDDGMGIPHENLTRIFEPFYTTKEVGKGTGLGLSMVYGIVKQHNGFIEVTSAPGKGARFSIFLPPTRKALSAAPPEDPRPQASRLPRGALRLLVVDDEEDLRDFARDVLGDLCKELHLAADGTEAVAALQAHLGEIDLVILDLTMPRMSGVECFREMRKIAPELRVIVTSGYSVRAGAGDLLREGAVAFLPKPYNVQSLLRAVESAMGMPVPGRGGGDVVAG